jgi:Domain of unknown function (DUF1833)
MPANFDSAFALWLTQHGSERSAAVNVLQFSHDAWDAPIYVSDYGEEFTARDEGGAEFTALPLGFVIDVAADNVTTEQRVLIRLDNASGVVGAQLRTLTDEDLLTPLTVVYRVYLDTDRDGPQIDPMTLFVVDVHLSRLVVECEASADFLPNVSAGTRYTVERFPTLAFV